MELTGPVERGLIGLNSNEWSIQGCPALKWEIPNKMTSFLKTGVFIFLLGVMYGCEGVITNIALSDTPKPMDVAKKAGVFMTQDSTLVEKCRLIKEVSSETMWGGFATKEWAGKKVLNDLIEGTKKAGGNVLLIKEHRNTLWSGSSAVGSAYRCEKVTIQLEK